MVFVMHVFRLMSIAKCISCLHVLVSYLNCKSFSKKLLVTLFFYCKRPFFYYYFFLRGSCTPPHLPVGVLLHQGATVDGDGDVLHAVVFLLTGVLKAGEHVTLSFHRETWHKSTVCMDVRKTNQSFFFFEPAVISAYSRSISAAGFTWITLDRGFWLVAVSPDWCLTATLSFHAEPGGYRQVAFSKKAAASQLKSRQVETDRG